MVADESMRFGFGKSGLEWPTRALAHLWGKLDRQFAGEELALELCVFTCTTKQTKAGGVT